MGVEIHCLLELGFHWTVVSVAIMITVLLFVVLLVVLVFIYFVIGIPYRKHAYYRAQVNTTTTTHAHAHGQPKWSRVQVDSYSYHDIMYFRFASIMVLGYRWSCICSGSGEDAGM